MAQISQSLASDKLSLAPTPNSSGSEERWIRFAQQGVHKYSGKNRAKISGVKSGQCNVASRGRQSPEDTLVSSVLLLNFHFA